MIPEEYIGIFKHAYSGNLVGQVEKIKVKDYEAVKKLLAQKERLLLKVDINLKAMGILEENAPDVSADLAYVPQSETEVVVPSVAAPAAAAPRELPLATVAAPAVEPGEVKWSTRKTRQEVVEFLRNILEYLSEQLGGKTIVSDVDDATLEIKMLGAPNLLYSVYSAFGSQYLHSDQQLDGTWEGSFKVSTAGLKKKMLEKGALQQVTAYLQAQGYGICSGQKTVEQTFSEDNDFISENSAAFKARLGVDLRLALAMADMPQGSKVLLPMAVEISTMSDNAMTDLEACYREAGLIGANGQPKQFIINTRNQGQLHKSNLALGQAVELLTHFEQRAMLSKAFNEPVAALVSQTNDMVSRSVSEIRKFQLRQLDSALRASQAAKTAAITSGYALCAEPQRGATAELATRRGYGVRFGYAAQRDGGILDHVTFMQRLEELVNDNYILGPAAFNLFLGLTPAATPSAQAGARAAIGGAARPALASSSDYALALVSLEDRAAIVPASGAASAGAMAAVAARTSSAMVSYDPSYASTYSSNVAKHGGAADMLRAIDPELPEAEKAELVAKYKATAPGSLVEIRAFFKAHTPFFVMQQLFAQMEGYLATATERQIEAMLKTFGVSDAQLDSYKMQCGELYRYNRYHIKFVMPMLILESCLSNNVLLNPKVDSQAGAAMCEYFWNPQAQVRASDSDGAAIALEWTFNQTYGCLWGVTHNQVDRSVNSYTRGMSSQGSTGTSMGGRSGVTGYGSQWGGGGATGAGSNGASSSAGAGYGQHLQNELPAQQTAHKQSNG